MAVLDLERDGAVATLWLERPEARNAMGRAFFDELPSAMAELSDDARVRAVVIAARGPHFTVGLDLKEMGGALAGGSLAGGSLSGGSLAGGSLSGGSLPGARAEHEPDEASRRPPSAAAQAAGTRRSVLRMQAAITAVADCPKPVVAAVHGYCIGGGMDLVTACDIRLASADAVFSVRETRIAIVADLGTLQRLPRIVAAGHVAELAFTGKDVDAARAKEIGLVNDVFPDHDAVVAAARALAEEIAALSPLAVQGTKAVLAANDGQTVAQGLEYVAAWNAGMLGSEDLVEALRAFVEKRPPRFTGH